MFQLKMSFLQCFILNRESTTARYGIRNTIKSISFLLISKFNRTAKISKKKKNYVTFLHILFNFFLKIEESMKIFWTTMYNVLLYFAINRNKIYLNNQGKFWTIKELVVLTLASVDVPWYLQRFSEFYTDCHWDSNLLQIHSSHCHYDL